jgi:hypothetical protein
LLQAGTARLSAASLRSPRCSRATPFVSNENLRPSAFSGGSHISYAWFLLLIALIIVALKGFYRTAPLGVSLHFLWF